MEAVMMIGLPGSGKSTKALEIKKKSHIIVNKDGIRQIINGGEYIFDEKKEDLIESIADAMLFQSIIAGYSVIIDETNILKKIRQEKVYFLKEIMPNINIKYIWCTENDKNLSYRMNESRGISKEKWHYVIKSMKESFEPPCEDFIKKYNITLEKHAMR